MIARVAMLALLAAVAFGAAVPKKMVGLSGSSTSCVNGKVHSLKYNTYGASEDVFVDLDTLPITSIQCDVDHTRLLIKFHNDADAADYLVRFHDWNDHFLVGGAAWNCTTKPDGDIPGLVVRRVVGASMPDAPSDTLEVVAVEARYDEIYDSADISFNTQGECDSESFVPSIDKRVCVGFNTNCISGATASLPIWSNKFVTVACSDCYIDFTIDVFFDISIRDFRVQNLSAGFRDIAVNGSAVIDAQAQANWNTGIDKTLTAIQTTYLVNFKVGPVPFMIFFELPVEIKTSLTFTSQADATFGAQLNWAFGGAYLTWNPIDHWRHMMPDPVVQYTPQFSTSASFNAEGTLTVIPTLRAHFDRILTYSLTATPELDITISGSEASKQVCLDSTYDLTVTGLCELDINIPWANIAKDWQWTQNVYNSGVQTIEKKCLAL